MFDKIKQFAAVLADPAATSEDRAIALEFLLHFVGDIHQPPHAADNHDQGGNAVSVTYSDRDRKAIRTKTVNLQALASLARWIDHYNTERPHSSLGYVTEQRSPPSLNSDGRS